MDRKGIGTARDTFRETVRQRCFWLFCALLALLVSVPFVEEERYGRVTLAVYTLLVVTAGAAVVGRGGGAVISTLLAVPTAGFLVLARVYELPGFLLTAQLFGAAFFFVVTAYLISYVFRRDVLTMDKLYGAAAAYLLLGVMWTYFYWILLIVSPGALTLGGEPMINAAPSTMLYFSFVTLTATGMSDIMPLDPVARMICSLEMITGVLFIAVLIARLASSYSPSERQDS
jgi:hypothetical protein